MSVVPKGPIPSDVLEEMFEDLCVGGCIFPHREYTNREEALLFLEELKVSIPELQEIEKNIKIGLRKLKEERKRERKEHDD